MEVNYAASMLVMVETLAIDQFKFKVLKFFDSRVYGLFGLG